MKCNHCFHLLPDDSEFCQYCGAKIEKISFYSEDSPVNPTKNSIKNQTNDSKQSNEISSFFSSFAKNTADQIAANSREQPDLEDSSDFGLVPENPIYSMPLEFVEGQKTYLSSLKTTDGEKITWTRRGSVLANGVHGMVDVYDTFLPSGAPYKTVYINMYGAKKSQRAPTGFTLATDGLDNVKQKPKIDSPLSNNPVMKNSLKKKYCKKCGSEITGKKRCDNCYQGKKQWIKNKRILILAILVFVFLIGNIAQLTLYYNSNKDLQKEYFDLKSEFDSQNTSLTNYEKIINQLRESVVAKNDLHIGSASNSFHMDKGIQLFPFKNTTYYTRVYSDSKDIELIRIYGDNVIGNIDQNGSYFRVGFSPLEKGVSVFRLINKSTNEHFEEIIIIY